MKIVRPGDPEYESDRRIANARFDYRPSYICYCRHVADVKEAIGLAKKEKAKNPEFGIRIRSGGHQHEGMCSGNNVLIIDLSGMQNICFSNNLETVRIEAGAKLADVYEQTWARNRILPGGGCGDVRIGGLVQGGGWGPYSRALGLTCDRLSGFRMVKADGEEIEVTGAKDDPHHDLFWAVCGGGGGNFGVITEFTFKLAGLPFPIWQFTLTWKEQKWVRPVIEEWCKNFPGNEEFRLTSFCRLGAAGSPDPPVIVAGFFLEDQAPLEALLKSLLPKTYAAKSPPPPPLFTPVHQPVVSDPRRLVHHPEYQPGPPLAAPALAAEEPPKDTCDGGYYPHKVSSCFPNAIFSTSSKAMETIVAYLAQSKPETMARRYLSLHCMGGTINSDPAWAREWSCFPFRDKPFMLQYQAWWGDRNDKPLGDRCLAWVRGFRETMKPYTEGAFINFPDKDLVPNPNTPDGRKALLRYYYAHNLEPLIERKRKYDPENFFNFEMGIPIK